MKKLLSLFLCAVMMVAVVAFVGCSDESKDSTGSTASNNEVVKLKFGSGVYVSAPSTTDATADKEGTGKVDITVAAVTLDKDGKIVACALDTASNTVKFTADGKAIANDGFKTKAELGNDYNMVAYGQATAEWYQQADNFEKLVAGKTLAEVKALVAEGNKGTDAVINAGCTIMIHEFVGAIEKAVNAAADSDVTAEHVLKVTAYTEQTCTDATADKDGSNKVSTTVFAAALSSDGSVAVASSDCVEVSFTFTTAGVSTLDTTKAVVSKKEQGSNYGMVAYGNAAKEWFEQAAAFDAACIGKLATEIAGLIAEDGKGVDTLKDAGCTIYVTGFVKAASKI